MSRRLGERDDSREVIDEKRRMRFPRRTEIVLDADVQLECADAIPKPTTLALVGRLRNLGQPEDGAVERAGSIFFAARNRDLNVMERDGGHANYSLSYFRSRRKHEPASMSKTTHESIGRE
jgi:hypothetical protein